VSWPDVMALVALAFIAWYMRRVKGARVADLKAYADRLVQEKDDLLGMLIKQAEAVVCSLCRGAREVNGIEPGGPSVPCPLCTRINVEKGWADGRAL